uniref:Uncharacterized protein n=1 Tax=Gibberella zeae TaxID=5518 RepID=A0A4E9DZ99_GIBZA
MSDCAHKAYRVFAAVFPNLYAQKLSVENSQSQDLDTQSSTTVVQVTTAMLHSDRKTRRDETRQIRPPKYFPHQEEI